MKTFLFLLIGFFVVSTAQAMLTFSDVSYTANTVSFRASGDLSGYDLPARPEYFTVSFEGDLYTTGIYPNISWSNTIFDGATIADTGYSGDFSTWNNPGAWVQYSPSLDSSSQALGAVTTLTLGADLLNTSSMTGEIVFNWDVDSDLTQHVELGRVSVNPVPVPSSLGLVLIGLAGSVLGYKRRSKV